LRGIKQSLIYAVFSQYVDDSNSSREMFLSFTCCNQRFFTRTGTGTGTRNSVLTPLAICVLFVL